MAGRKASSGTEQAEGPEEVEINDILEAVQALLDRVSATIPPLINALGEVEAAFRRGDDDWRYRLVKTFRNLAHAAGVEPKLTVAIWQLEWEQAEATFKARARARGKRHGTNPRPFKEVGPLTIAAAAISVLYDRRVESGVRSIKAAVNVVADLLRLDKEGRRRLETFRLDVMRVNYGEERFKFYESEVKALRALPIEDVRKQVELLAVFM